MIADEDEGWDFSGTRSRKRWLPPAERAAERKKECTEVSFFLNVAAVAQTQVLFLVRSKGPEEAAPWDG